MKNYSELLNENKEWAASVFEKINKKTEKMAIRSRDKIVDGVDECGMHKAPPRITSWTSGFWPALNFMLYEYTKNEEYLKTGRNVEKLLDEALAQVDVIHHDVGFMWHIMSAADYRITGNKDARTRALFAASTLMSRFVLGGDFIRAWNTPQSVNWTIIDTMMNLPLLYWASEEIGDDRFKRIAMAHADMAYNDHIRADGSVVHIAEHDRETGEVVATHGGQGIGVGSSWSRGQAWALYGFVLSYIHTGEERYINAAKQVANYFIANCCDDWLPRVDFRAPSQPVYYDSTAGAIAACGLIELGKRLPEDEGGTYMNAALKILHAMEEKFIDYDVNNDCLLGYGTVRYPADGMTPEKAGVHVSIIYGDYFYTEAILKLLGSEFLPW